MSCIPVISVVIPLYNRGPYIARAIRSVLSQTEQRFEIIVVDGDSTDNGPKIVNSFKDDRILFYTQRGSGVSSARNEGVRHSQSDFIAFLDADDEWTRDHIETLMKLRNRYPEAGAYATAYVIKFPNSRIRPANYFAIPDRPWEGLLQSYFKSGAFGSPPVWTSAVGIPKHIFMELGGFKDGVWWGEDTDLWGRIALRYPIAFSWNGIGIYHTEASNRVCTRAWPIEENVFVRTARDALEAGEVSSNMREDLLEYVAMKQIESAFHNLSVCKPKFARENLKGCATKKQAIKKYLVLFLAYAPYSIYSALRRLSRFI